MVGKEMITFKKFLLNEDLSGELRASLKKKITDLGDYVEKEVEQAKERKKRREEAEASATRGERERHKAREERGEKGRKSER